MAKQSFYNLVHHHGFQPVRVLELNVLDSFQRTTPDFQATVEEAVLNRKFKKSINYSINQKPIFYSYFDYSTQDWEDEVQMPFADLERQINIHESFLSYLWCWCYALLVVYQEGIQKPILKNEFKGEIDFSLPHIGRAINLLHYGLRLKRSFEEWDHSWPNPEEYDPSNEEGALISAANGIFLEAVKFILAHEFSHVDKGHIDELETARKNNVPIDPARVKVLEYEADASATKLLYDGITNENRLTVEVGLVAAICSLLAFGKKIESNDHPDMDDRIRIAINTGNPPEAAHVWMLSALAIRFYCEEYNVAFNWTQEANSPKELLLDLLNQLGALKAH